MSVLLCFGASKVLSGWSHLQGAVTVLAAAPPGQQTAKQGSCSGRRVFCAKEWGGEVISRGVLPTPRLGQALTAVSTARCTQACGGNVAEET